MSAYTFRYLSEQSTPVRAIAIRFLTENISEVKNGSMWIQIASITIHRDDRIVITDFDDQEWTLHFTDGDGMPVEYVVR